jgi:hypothetical protein
MDRNSEGVYSQDGVTIYACGFPVLCLSMSAAVGGLRCTAKYYPGLGHDGFHVLSRRARKEQSITASL